MYSVLDHEERQNKPPTPQKISNDLNNNYEIMTKQPYQSMHNGLQGYGNKYQSNQQPKMSMKQLYKNQLDQFMEEKDKQRRAQKQLMQREKQEYRQTVRQGQQNQKMKDMAYKNYYKLLMQSHDHNSESYVSPYQHRDRLKESHIQYSIQQQMQRSKNYEYQKRMRQVQKKNAYKEQLARQIQERKVLQSAKKNYLNQQNNYYKQHTISPHQIEAYQKEKKKGEMELYKHDLDKIVQEKNHLNKISQRLSNHSEPVLRLSEDHHNPLVNPMPYNIQNPYILKEMQKLSALNIKNQPQLQIYQTSQRQRNQSSYFARQANNVLK